MAIRPIRPHAAGRGGMSVNGNRMVFMGILMLLIAVAAVSGIVYAISSGQPTVAMVIGLVAAAFFSRVGC